MKGVEEIHHFFLKLLARNVKLSDVITHNRTFSIIFHIHVHRSLILLKNVYVRFLVDILI